ncbi:HNH endonuclease [Consotaella salsifontis]|uniref:HNH endonuclease n=1 Tax=Consotaella salsifontis TaxID=1365950 RepID=UPI00099ACFE4|nr:HNH endonuclease [Consotaella salsifontis]
MKSDRPDQRSAEADVYRRLYKTPQWRALRLSKLSQDPLCQWCLEREIVETATEVHHARPHRGDEGAFWRGPFISTCKACHASRGQREDLGQDVVTFRADGWPA